jgi:hypothetical protein
MKRFWLTPYLQIINHEWATGWGRISNLQCPRKHPSRTWILAANPAPAGRYTWVFVDLRKPIIGSAPGLYAVLDRQYCISCRFMAGNTPIPRAS